MGSNPIRRSYCSIVQWIECNFATVWTNRKHNEKTKKKIGKANSKYQSGKNNSQYGTCWIYNTELKENKKIDKSEIDKWLNENWKKGRKMNL